jgi:hypothetical protein
LQSDWYWSGSEGDNNDAWIIHMGNGNTDIVTKFNTMGYYAICVRNHPIENENECISTEI